MHSKQFLFFCVLALISGVQLGYSQMPVTVDQIRVFINNTPESQIVRNQQVGSVTESALKSISDRGFLAAEVDSVLQLDNRAEIYLSSGPRFDIGTIFLVSDQDTTELQVNRVYSSVFIEESIKSLLHDLQESGYPLASVFTEKLIKHTSDNIADVVLRINKGEEVLISSLRFEGTRQLSSRYLLRESGFREPFIYSSEKESGIRESLVNSRFITDVDHISIVKIGSDWALNVEIEEIRPSFIDFVAGYNPGQRSGGQFVGRGELHLHNLISEGSSALLHFERLPFSESRLRTGFMQYWVVGLPLGAGFNATFYQRDSTYYRLGFSIVSELDLPRNFTVGLILETSSTQSDERVTSNPALDSQTRLVRTFLSYQKLDRRVNPTQGNRFRVEVETGFKRLSNIPESLNLSSMYLVSGVEMMVQSFFRVTSNQVLTPRMFVGFQQSEVYFEDDLYRLGGSFSIRGYLEEQFRVSKYVWGDVEYRYLLNRNAYAFTFGSIGLYEAPVSTLIRNPGTFDQTLYSAGFGFSYRVQPGILRFSYAVSPDDRFTNGKVHFGIINTF